MRFDSVTTPRPFRRSWKRVSATMLGLAAAGFIGWGVHSTFHAVRPHHWSHIQIAGGPVALRRQNIGEAFARDALQNDLDVEIVTTEGFEDSIRQVAAGKIEMAGVSSGLMIPECKEVRLLAGIGMAALHILVRRDLAAQQDSLTEMIRGHRVNVGPPGTNDYFIAANVLSFLRLRPNLPNARGDYEAVHLSTEKIAALAQAITTTPEPDRQDCLQQLPQIIITLLPQPSPLAQYLIDTGEYTLIPFPYVDAFLRSNLTPHNPAEQAVDRLLIEPCAIRAGMYIARQPVPASDCPTLGLRTLLVARADMPPETVGRVMKTLFESDIARRVHPQPPGEFATNYAVHPAAQAYVDRGKPWLTGVLMEEFSELLSIGGAFIAGALSLYGFYRRRRIRSPGEYLLEIQQIDALLHNRDGAEPHNLPPALVQQLDLRLTHLKQQLIRDYCGNRVQGEMVLLSILSSLADSRSQLRSTVERRGEILSLTADPPPFAVNESQPTESPMQVWRHAA